MKQRKLAYWIIFILITATLLFLALFYKTEKPLKLVMLDIGQGDGIYIETPNGTNMLIDSGRDKTVLYELGEVMNFNQNKIDIIEISNPDLDHIGGFPFVMQRYKIKNIISPGTNHDSLEAFGAIEKLAQEKQIPVLKPKQGAVIMLDQKENITYTILWPTGNVNGWEVNAGSLVGLITYGDKKILLTGDAPKEVEDQIINKYKDELQNIDILKVGHHGSKTSTGSALTMLARPKYALISAGKNNRYGHPHKIVLDNLNNVGAKILVTKDNGQITCTIWLKKETVCD